MKNYILAGVLIVIIFVAGYFIFVKQGNDDGDINAGADSEEVSLNEPIVLSSPRMEYQPGETIVFDVVVSGVDTTISDPDDIVARSKGILVLILTDGGQFEEDLTKLIPDVLGDGRARYQLEFPTSKSASGAREFWAVGMFGGDVYKSNKIKILVKPSEDQAKLQQIWFSQSGKWDGNILLFPDMTHQLPVYGLYTDGYVRKIDKELGTKFFENKYGFPCFADSSGSLEHCSTPSETDVFDISEDGLITAITPGRARVLVENGEIKGQIEIQVESIDDF